MEKNWDNILDETEKVQAEIYALENELVKNPKFHGKIEDLQHTVLIVKLAEQRLEIKELQKKVNSLAVLIVKLAEQRLEIKELQKKVNSLEESINFVKGQNE